MKKEDKEQHEAPTKEKFYILFVKWFTWQKVGVLLAVIGVIVPFIIFMLEQEDKEKEIDIVKNRIFEKIDIIKSSFHPDDIPVELDSLYDVRLVREFQKNSLSICTLWETIERTEPYLYHLKNSEGEADFVWERNMKRDHQCDSLIMRVEKIVCEIQSYATDNDLDAYQLVNYSLLFKFRKMMVKKSNMFIETSKKATEYRYKYDFKESYRLYDELRERPDYYTFDDTFFEFLIETNKIYDLAIQNYIK